MNLITRRKQLQGVSCGTPYKHRAEPHTARGAHRAKTKVDMAHKTSFQRRKTSCSQRLAPHLVRNRSIQLHKQLHILSGVDPYHVPRKSSVGRRILSSKPTIHPQVHRRLQRIMKKYKYFVKSKNLIVVQFSCGENMQPYINKLIYTCLFQYGNFK